MKKVIDIAFAVAFAALIVKVGNPPSFWVLLILYLIFVTADAALSVVLTEHIAPALTRWVVRRRTKKLEREMRAKLEDLLKDTDTNKKTD